MSHDRVPDYRFPMDSRLEWALSQVDLRLTALGRRHTHSRAVGTRAAEIGALLVGDEAPTLIAAAFLHDIGYAPELSTTGFHPLDGARFVRDRGHPDIAALVAHHTGARYEAGLRGLDLEEEFPYCDSPLQRALTYCDLTTDPDGQPTTVAARVAEIVERYGAGHPVGCGVQMGLPEFLEIEREIDSLLSGSAASTR